VVPSHFHVRSPEVNSSPVDGASGKLIAMSILYQVAIGLELLRLLMLLALDFFLYFDLNFSILSDIGS